MALGFSGSTGGIGKFYQKVLEVDIEAGLRKYEELLPLIKDTKYVSLYNTVISDLKKLLSAMKISDLEKKV